MHYKSVLNIFSKNENKNPLKIEHLDNTIMLESNE